MAGNKKLLFLAGSIRKGSFNCALAKAAYDIAKTYDVDAEYIDLADYKMPLFDQDEEASNGMDESAKKLKKIFSDADGYFIATPEYNGSYTPLLKNTLDWLSRAHTEGEPRLSAFDNKAAAIGGASPGGFGAMRALVPLRLLLANVGVNVVGNQIAVAAAHEAFDDNGKITSANLQTKLEGIISTLVRIA